MLLLNYSTNTFFWSWSIKEDQQKQSHYFPGQDTNKGISGHNLVAGNIDDCPSSFVFFGFIIVNEPPKCLVIIKMCPNIHRTQSNLNQSIIKQKLLWKIYWKKECLLTYKICLPLYFQIKIYDENWFLLSMVSGDGQAKMDKHYCGPGLHITQALGSSQYYIVSADHWWCVSSCDPFNDPLSQCQLLLTTWD